MVYPGPPEHAGPSQPAPDMAHASLQDARAGQGWGRRHTLAVLGSLGMAATYLLRTSLSVAIVAMVGTRPSNDTELPGQDDVCPFPDDHPDYQYQDGEFDWDEQTQGFILGSLYWGYAGSQLALGWACTRVGGRLVLGVGMLVASLLSLLVPLAARASPVLLQVVRMLQGAALGGSFPAVTHLMTTWFPPQERSRYTTFIMSGINLGTVVALPVTGLLCDTSFLGGWPSPFYLFGGVGVVWSLAWLLVVTERPEHHPTISDKELRYIQATDHRRTAVKTLKVPWAALLTSPWVWVVVVTALGDALAFYTLLNEMPTYLANIHHFDLSSTGLVSALPYLASVVVCVIWAWALGPLAAALPTRRVRQLSEAVSAYLPATCLVGVCLVQCRTGAVVGLLCLAVGLCNTNMAGYISSPQDLSPNFSGVVYGVIGTASSSMGFLAPVITGAIINNRQTLQAWNTVFLVSAASYVVTCTLFLLFTPAAVQPWNQPALKPAHAAH